MKKNLPVLQIEDAEILFRNFAGEARPPYNKAGDRNFCVIIEPELAEDLKKQGYNIRVLKSLDNEDPLYYISVKIKTESALPPKIFLINSTSSRPILLDPSDYNILDYARFKQVDLTINPYIWSQNPQKVSAYLQEGYFTLEPDKFRDKYFLQNE